MNSVSVKVLDDKALIGIKDLNSIDVVQMPKVERKTETKYAFAKYYSDFNAWQDIELAIPKVIKSKAFKSFLTVYNDNGETMAPGESNKMTCLVSS